MSPAEYDVAIIGGGPAGATAAYELAKSGASVLLLDREGRPKPCGGAVPPRLIEDFEIPPEQIVARVATARIISPKSQAVEMTIDGHRRRAGTSYVGMVDREKFDRWLRQRAEAAGADLKRGTFEHVEERDGGGFALDYRDAQGARVSCRSRLVIGADGANSAVRRQMFSPAARPPYVFAYHEIVRSPESGDFDKSRCDVVYDGAISPDFYGWVFPHGPVTSVGVGSAKKGFDLKAATSELRRRSGLGDADIVRREGAPLPLYPLKRFDNGRGVLLIGDAAGVVAPSSGEGIYYAMCSGELAGQSALETLRTNDVRALKSVRSEFGRMHGRTFFILRMMQYFWYSSDGRRERFVSMCRDPDVQKLTWESYLDKKIVRREPMAHLRVFLKDMSHLMGIAKA